MSDATEPAASPGRLTWVRGALPGTTLAVAIAVVATVIGWLLPVVGAPVAAIVIGVGIAVLRPSGPVLQPGIRFASRGVLQLSVVVLGTQLSLRQIGEVGASSLPVMLGTIAACLLAAVLLGRLLKVEGDLGVLIAVGTAICGASAIAAVTPVIRAAGSSVAYAVSTIFLFNACAVLLFPPLGQLLGMEPATFGLFAGTAINDTSSVVAAAATYGELATDHAVVVKLVRTLMIIPICLALAAWVGRRGASAQGDGARSRVAPLRLIPWFLVGFLLAATINSIGLVPEPVRDVLGLVAVFLITVAMAAIGLSTDLARIRAAGARPLLLGGGLWIVVTWSSLLLLAMLGTI